MNRMTQLPVSELQTMLDTVDTLSNDQLPDLFCSVAAYKDAAAVVHVYDKLKDRKIPVSPVMWEALKTVESDRHRTSVFTVPVPAVRTLDPARRVHKICKGGRMSDRNKEAASHIGPAKQWVLAQAPGSVDARSSASARMKTARALSKHLNIDLETARGVLTTLKRMKIL
jgi:hypothetical protein